MKAYKPVQGFAKGVSIFFSSASDGSTAAGAGNPPLPVHRSNADNFLKAHGLKTKRSRVFVSYEPSNTYAHILRVDRQNEGGDFRCDALYTTEKDLLITLPVADCIATVVYDPVAHMLAVLHLGRHSSIAGLIEAFAIEVADNVGSDPRDWHVWMSPSLQAESNAMDYFEPPNIDQWTAFMRPAADGKIHIDNPGHNRERFERIGVPQGNIYVSPINTFTDERYFSHRAATESRHPERQGRMMLASIMTS